MAMDRRTFVTAAGAAMSATALMSTGVALADAPAEEEAPRGPMGGEPLASARELYEWLPQKPEIPADQIVETYDYDVVVVGGGHSGTQCAKEAAKAGAKVAVIDWQSQDFFMFYGEDIGTFNSQYVINMGYGPYDEQDILAQWERTGGYRPNPDLVLTYIRNSGAMIDDALALVAERDPDALTNMNVQQPDTAYWTDKSQPCDMGNFKTYVGTFCMRSEILDEIAEGVGAYSTIGRLEDCCREFAQENGAEWHYDLWGEVLVQDETGAVTGVIAKNDDDQYVQFNASKAVVIACGAFQNNAPMMREFYNENRELQAKNGIKAYAGDTIPTSGRDSGIGHRMGCWAGGRMEAGPMASLANVSAPGPFGFAPTLVLNRNGKRFMNEADFNAMGNMINRQPKGLYCNVFGANWREVVARSGTNHGGTDFGQETYVAQWTEDMEKVLEAGANGYVVRHGCLTERADMGQTPVYGANTLEELATYMGYEGEAVENFVKSVEHYNEIVAAGIDSDYGKDARFLLPIEAPYYGSVSDTSTQGGSAITLGGLVTDATFNVLDDNDNGIPGLYAIGNCCGQRFSLTYPGILAGNSIGMAMTNGYVCGQIVAAL
ncbi:MAG: FAD-binding protein [Coriobacteriales bacterium]|nr:FAD-binding protein [Coriobacteriales bacterium]